ncbi:MAG: hypothetical protein ACN6O1_11020 [Comamonas sp.]|uniref:hypothetical protein n=1 Tax=Comamonas sp. TaxID=34028 RepID=UPI003D0D0BF4
MSFPRPPTAHVCDYMRSSVAVLYDYLLGAGDEVPIPRKLSISKLAIMLRDEIDAAKRESPSVAAQQDQKFQAMKAQLLKKPRKNSRLYKEINHG